MSRHSSRLSDTEKWAILRRIVRRMIAFYKAQGDSYFAGQLGVLLTEIVNLSKRRTRRGLIEPRGLVGPAEEARIIADTLWYLKDIAK